MRARCSPWWGRAGGIISSPRTSSALGNQLLDRPCNVYPSDMRVKVSATGKYTYPDGVVACEEEAFDDEEKDTLLNPVIIIEILSESTEAYDRGKKFEQYQYIESLTEYLLIAQDPYGVEQYVRQSRGEWRYSAFHSADDVVPLGLIGCQLALKDVYAKIARPFHAPPNHSAHTDV